MRYLEISQFIGNNAYADRDEYTEYGTYTVNNTRFFNTDPKRFHMNRNVGEEYSITCCYFN